MHTLTYIPAPSNSGVMMVLRSVPSGLPPGKTPGRPGLATLLFLRVGPAALPRLSAAGGGRSAGPSSLGSFASRCCRDIMCYMSTD